MIATQTGETDQGETNNLTQEETYFLLTWIKHRTWKFDTVLLSIQRKRKKYRHQSLFQLMGRSAKGLSPLNNVPLSHPTEGGSYIWLSCACLVSREHSVGDKWY